MQTAVNVFVIEPMRYACSVVASSPRPTSADPTADRHTTSPSRNTAALTDGIRCSACAVARIRSRVSRNPVTSSPGARR